jgi:hypothetical protein
MSRCWLCEQTNPSYVQECSTCKGVTLPTVDGNTKNRLDWTIFSFDSNVIGRNGSGPTFLEAMEVFDTQNVAIRLSDEHRHILVRYPLREDTVYCVKTCEVVKTIKWNKDQQRDRDLFLRFWDENVDSSGSTYSKCDNTVLILMLIVVRNATFFMS